MTHHNASVSKGINHLAALWLGIAIAGQLAFFAYITMFYVFTALTGNIAQWNNNPLLMQPPVDTPSNTLAFGIHAIGAAYIALMGGIQLLSPVRKRFPTFHRYNGRVFLATVVALTATGFYLVWVRGPRPETLSELATSVNGVLILSFAFFTLRYAVARQLQQHNEWAIRLYLVANAQWFLRIGGFGYFLSMQALGIPIEFDGWFFQFWVWGCFLVPLALNELYLRARDTENTFLKRATIGGFALSILFTVIGSLAFSAFIFQMALRGGSA